jgi:hypothetical protein
VAKQTGLDTSAISGLLPMLAPIVMGALGREKRQRGMDVGGPGRHALGRGPESQRDGSRGPRPARRFAG